jgi:hypothetical protein
MWARKILIVDTKVADTKAPDTIKPDTVPHWWDTNWKYCRQIKISGATPSGYSLAVDLDPVFFDHTHTNADLSDVRFLEGTCSNPDTVTGVLPAWVEKVDPAKGSKIWFKMQTANIVNIAMYYGNTLASNIFDGNNVFPLFDSFDGSSLDLSKWVFKGTCNVASGLLKIADAPSSFFYIVSLKTFGTGYVFTVRAAFKGSSSVDSWDAYFGFRHQNVSISANILWVYDGQTTKYVSQGDASQSTTSANSLTDNNFHTWKIDRNQTSADMYYDGILVHNLTQNYPIGTYPIILHTNHDGVLIEADWVFVRLKVTPEPTINIGSEKTQ